MICCTTFHESRSLLNVCLLAGSPLIDAGTILTDEPGRTFVKDYSGSAPDLGVYELEPSQSYYWIPGHRSATASWPIPTHESITALPDAELIFLEALDADSHKVYLSRSETGPFYMYGALANGRNVLALPALLGGAYYWRVDAHNVDGSLLTTGPPL